MGTRDAPRGATGISPGKMMFLLIWFYGCVTIEKIHPLEGGYLRRKVRPTGGRACRSRTR